MSTGAGNRIHVAGNAVLDLVVRHAGGAAAVTSWGRGTVRFLEEPVVPALGGAAATAYLVGRLGARVSLNTQVGEDALGALVRNWLADAGVELVGPVAAATATNVIHDAPDGTPAWHYYTGPKVDWRRSLAVDNAAWFYASGYGQATGEELALLTEVFEVFRARGAKVVFDPGPWLFARAERKQMEDAWTRVDCLIGTEPELSTWHAADSIEALVGRLLGLGPRQVVVKRGADGAAFGQAGETCRLLGTDPVPNAHVVGAGDTFNGALLYGLSRGQDLADAVGEALRLATAVVAAGKGVLVAVS